MAKKNDYKFLYSIIFGVILLSPFGFSSSYTEPSDEYYELTILTSIPNFFLKPFNIEFNPIIQQAFATNHTNATYPIITRGVDYELTQWSKHNFTSNLGLKDYIERFDGVFIPHEYWEDNNALTFNSADLSFVFDKNACAYTLYNQGRIFNNSTEVIKSDTWVVKYAENGTDTWFEVPQNSLGCTVQVTDFNVNGTDYTDDTFQIISTKTDVNGTIQQIMNKTVGVGMQHTVSYTNNNPSWNNTKIGFSHIFSGTPDYISVMTNSTVGNSTGILFSKYATNSTIPDTLANNATMVNATTPANISHDNFVINATSGQMIEDGFTFHFLDNDSRQIHYDFDKGIDKLWNMRFTEVINGNQSTTELYLDYMNDQPVLPIGNTTTIDPIVTIFGSGWTVNRIIAQSSTQFPDPNLGCANNGLGCTFQGLDSFAGHTAVTDTFAMAFYTIDISSIPANADVQAVTHSQQFSSLFFATVQRSSTGAEYYTLNGEDVPSLSGQSLLDCLYVTPLPWSENNPSDTPTGLSQTPVPAGGSEHGDDNRVGLGNPTTNPCGTHHIDMTNSPTLPNHRSGIVRGFPASGLNTVTTHDGTGDLALDLEQRFLQLGLTQYTFYQCSQTWAEGVSALIGNNGCAGNLLNTGVLSQGALVDPVGGSFQPFPATQDFSWALNTASASTFMSVDFQVLTQPTAPLNLVCNPQLSSVDLDWFAPIDLGGAPFVDGYRIERDSGGGFTVLVASTGSGLTFFQDNTITAGLTFSYRVAAVTPFGVGLFSNEVSCGLPEISDPPSAITAQNQALNLVVVNWSPAIFGGNLPPTGFVIERTEGSPTSQSAVWSFLAQNVTTDATASTVGTSSTGDSFILTQPQIFGTKTYYFLFQSFDRDEINQRPLFVDWSGACNESVATGGNCKFDIQLWDGEYDRFTASDFPIGICGVGDCGATTQQSFPTKGAGLLHQRGINTIVSTGAQDFTFDEEPFGVEFFMDTTGAFAPDGKVTLMIRMMDTFNAGSPNNQGGSLTVRSIAIEGMERWDFGSSPTADIISADVGCAGGVNCGTVTVGNLEGTNQGFVRLERDTETPLVTEFLDFTVAQLRQYGYRVSQINTQGISEPSFVALVFTIGLPEKPINLVVTPTGTTTMSVTWDDGELRGGTVAFYTLERKTGIGGIFQVVASSSDQFFNDIFLSPSQEFCYRVKVQTNAGESGFTDEVCATTFDAPAVVENLLVVALDGSSVNMQFDDPLDDGGSPITGFKVERKIGAGAFNVLDALTFVKIRNDTGLQIGTLITYRVSATNIFGFGATTEASDTTDATPQAPPNFACSPASTTAITLTWDTPLTFTTPTGYQIDRKLVGGAFSTIVADTGTPDTTFTDTTVTTDTVFVYRILAKTPESDTDFSLEISCITLGAPDFPPENTQADFTTIVPHEVSITWDIPETFGIPITEFKVERQDGVGFLQIGSTTGSTTLFTDTTPDNDVDQEYRITTVGTEGDSPISIAIPADTNQISHWHYENTIQDTGSVKATSLLNGVNSQFVTSKAHIGQGFFFNNTFIEVDTIFEGNYDYNVTDDFAVSTYYSGNNATGTQCLVCKSNTIDSIGWKFFLNAGLPTFELTNTDTTNEIAVEIPTFVTNDNVHFLSVSYNGNGTASGVEFSVNGTMISTTILVDNLSGSTLNNEKLTIGATSDSNNKLLSVLDETRIFVIGIDEDQVDEIANDKVDTTANINATITIAGSTFANISGESPLIIMTSGFPLPTIGTINLQNFSATTVNSFTPALIIDGVSGQFTIDPQFFNQMSSLSNYTAISSLTNVLETFGLLSNFDVQSPVFTFLGDFFFQQQRNDDFTILSFNFTSTIQPFSLDCNIKSELFSNGTTFSFPNVFFVQALFVVPKTVDVVVACVDPSIPPIDPLAPSFGGSNALLSFVSFGDTTGIGSFLAFTENYGDFFGAGLPFLFIIILASLFTGRSAPTGIIIIGVALGIMWFLEIITLDPIMWGVIVVLVILGALAGKKFL